MCLETVLWSGSEPMCTGKMQMYEVSVHPFLCLATKNTCFVFILYLTSDIDCGPLDDPAKGEVSLSSTIFTSVANYSCNTGYTLTGDDMRMCFETGLWSGSEPTCTGLGSIIKHA